MRVFSESHENFGCRARRLSAPSSSVHLDPVDFRFYGLLERETDAFLFAKWKKRKNQTARVGLAPDETGLLPGIPGKRCAHCNTQTTPLWRNGPDGAKTLCNACGVRDNRRHAKTRGAPARPRPRKPEPGVAATTARLKKAAAAAAAAAELGEDAAGGRRSARWNAGLLTKRAKAESRLDEAARRAQKRRGLGGAPLHDAPGADVGADGTIFTPTSVDVVDYDAGNDGAFVPSASYVSARPRGAVGRFAPGGAAPLYDATAADEAWLAETNAGRPAHEHLRERQLEHLFDVFEEASWHSGSVPGDAAEAYDVLGYGGASVAEAEAAVKSGEMLVDFAAEEDLLSPAGAHLGLGHEGLAWDAVEPLKGASESLRARPGLKSENGSDRSYTPPLTPSGSAELAGFARADSASASVDGFGASGSPGGSVPSRGADDTDVDDDDEDRRSDDGDGSVFGSDASGNGKSSDLAVRATVTSSGRARRAAARGAGAAVFLELSPSPGPGGPAGKSGKHRRPMNAFKTCPS